MQNSVYNNSLAKNYKIAVTNYDVIVTKRMA